MTKLLPLLTTLIFSQAAFADRCEKQRDINLQFPSASFSELRLNALAGHLQIEAGSDNQIIIEGIACSDKTRYLDRMNYSLQR